MLGKHKKYTNTDFQEEERTLVRLAQRDPEHFAPLYERYVDRIYAYCARRVDSPQEAEDLCSQVFVHAIKGLRNFNDGVFSAWLFGIARNVVAGYYRRKRKVIPLEMFDIPDDNAVVSAGLEEDEDRRMLLQLVGTLPDDKRTLLTLVLDTRLTSAEVGKVLNRSATSVRVEFHRIVKGLRRQFKEMTGEDV